MEIREIKNTDYADLVVMFNEFAAFQKMPEKMINCVELMEQESQYINGFVIETDSGELVGYATCFYAYYTWIGKSLYMDDLYVKPESRGKGLGLKLINTVLNKAKLDNCKKVHWQVSGWNQNAIDFYKKLGVKVDNAEYDCDYQIIN